MPNYLYPRPDLINDRQVPIVITALFDVSGIIGGTNNPPRILVLHRSEKVAHYQNMWSMPAGVIDNPLLREHGPCPKAALLQSQTELAGELFLFPHDLCGAGSLCDRYLRVDPEKGKTFDTFLVTVETVYPEKVYRNWEHTDELWVPVEDILTGDRAIPEPWTPNLGRDLEALEAYMQDLLMRKREAR